MKKDCNIVKDLLPSYAYGLTNEETNVFIKKHLFECEDCKENLENIKKEEKISEEKKSDKYINFAKKYQNKLYTVRFIAIIFLFIIFAIIVIPILRKIFIISNLSNNAKQYSNISNMHIIKYSYNENSYVKNELWQMDNHKKMITTSLKDGKISNVEIYANKVKDGYELNSYSEVDGEKTNNKYFEKEFIGIYVENIFDKADFIQLLKASIRATIKDTIFDGKECYYILDFNRGNSMLSNGVYVDKETGLIINEISYQYSDEIVYPATTYIYEFDGVTENDLLDSNLK